MTPARFLYWGVLAAVLLPAAALTAVRLVEPDLARAVQLQAFTPFGLPLYAVGLALLLAGLWRGRANRRLLAVPLVLAVAGLGLHGWWFAPLVTGDVPEPRARGEEVVVLTANLFAGRGDSAQLVEEASEAGVDVLVVSEITERAVLDMEAVGLTEVFPHRAGKPGEGTVGTMVFSRDPIEVVDTLDTHFDGLRVRTGDLDLLAVHPAPPQLFHDWGKDHRMVLTAAQEPGVDLIAGDLNATLDHAPLRALADAGFRDTAELANQGLAATWPVDGGFPVLSWLPPSVAIDHVLVSDDWAVVTTETLDIEGADHRAVLATVALR
ncbi:MAG: endonuclease/exonuclease/phosphatase family protein [Nocardioides sp.]|nr:endonuclease/exonuclease/phosphatase family protein [Nocardioides sp.]